MKNNHAHECGVLNGMLRSAVREAALAARPDAPQVPPSTPRTTKDDAYIHGWNDGCEAGGAAILAALREADEEFDDTDALLREADDER